jgi:hypothetical protein
MRLRCFFLLAAAAWPIHLTFAQSTTGSTQVQPPAADQVKASSVNHGTGPGSDKAVLGSENAAPACPPVADRDWPVNLTIEARVSELMDASHLKPGKKIFATVLYGINYAECSLTDGAIVYGHVTAAASSKNPDSSELGLAFDHADCRGHGKQVLHLRLIGLVAPPSHREMLHSVLPSEVAGGVQQLPETSSDGIDDALSPEYYPRTVHPGLVVRLPTVKLEPEGGPGCSARISSPGRDIQLAPGTDLILTLVRVTNPKK